MRLKMNNLPSLMEDEELGDGVSVRVEVNEIGDITREVI